MKKTNLKTKEKYSKGITLVALIVTIIVLLILVGVTIITLTGDNGLLTKSKSAVDKYSDGEIEEQIKLAYLEYEMTRLSNTNLDAASYMKQSLEKIYGKNTVNISKEDGVFHVEITVSNSSKKYYLDNGEAGIYKDLEYYGVQIGDYIDYDCFTGVKSDELYYKSLSSLNGDSDQEFQVTETDKTRKWKVLGIDATGKLLITTADPIQTKVGSTYTLKGRAGYINGPDELNEISKIYGHGKGSIGARSIKVEDVNKITGQHLNDVYTKFTYTKNAEDGYIYLNNTENSGQTTFFYFENNNPKGEWKELESGKTSPEIENTYYNNNKIIEAYKI